MADIKSLLIGTLMSMQYPVFLQGTLAADAAYPDSFFTFWNNSTDDKAHYDSDAAAWEWSFDVNFYSTDPGTVNEALLTAKGLLKAAGFIVGGKGHDLVSDEPTHTGRGLDVLYREENTREV